MQILKEYPGQNKKALRVLISWHGAVEPAYRKLFDELTLKGIEVSIIAPKQWRESGRMIDFFNSNRTQYKTTILNTIFTNHMRAFFYPDIFKIANEIRTFKPDVIHIMEEPFSLAAFELMALKKIVGSKAKTVLYSFENIDIPQKFPYSFFQGYNLKNSDAIVVVPDESISLWENRGFRGTIAKIALGIDSNIFKKMDKDKAQLICGIKEDGEFKIGYVGRVVKEKGIGTVLNAMRLLKKIGKCPSFYIAGSGNYQEEILTLSRKYDLSDSLHFLGVVEQESLASFYNSLDALVLPSISTPIWKEQFGRVLPEAMSCGIPVIGSTSGEIPNVIGDAGLIFKEEDHCDLARQIESLRDDISLRSSLIDKGMKKAKDEYSWQTVAREYAKLYEYLMRESTYADP